MNIKTFYDKLKELGFVRTNICFGYVEYTLEKYNMNFHWGASNGDVYYVCEKDGTVIFREHVSFTGKSSPLEDLYERIFLIIKDNII